MAYKFRYISWADIRRKAEEVRERYCPGQVPIDIEAVIEFGFGLEIRPVRDLKHIIEFEGMLSKDCKTIMVDSYTFNHPSYEPRVRFTLAHELGHLCLHRDLYESHNFRSPNEWYELLESFDPEDLRRYENQANEFAGRLLVPVEVLERKVEELADQMIQLEQIACAKGIDDDEIRTSKKDWLLGQLSRHFHVSTSVIDLRLSFEKIPTP